MLLAEDNPGDVVLFREALGDTQSSISLYIVDNGEDALRFLLRRPPFPGALRPDVVVLDFNLPLRNGRDVLAEMMHQSELATIPVVFLTTSASEASVCDTYTPGRCLFFVKTADFMKLHEIVEQIVDYARDCKDMGKLTNKMLLIEDNPGDAVLLQEQLLGTPNAADLVTCGSLAEAKRLAAAEKFAVVFLDLSLPDSSGLETVRRAREAFKELPIVVLTGSADENLGIESLRAGAQDYLIKGNTTAEALLRAARYAIERQRILIDLEEARSHLEEKIQERTSELANTLNSLQEEVWERMQAEKQAGARADQLRALASELTLSEQRERRRMARVLHDHLQQLLVGVKIHLSLLERIPDEKIKKATAEIMNLVSESIDVTRTLTAELSPPALHEGGLPAGFKWLARWMEDKHRLAVNLEMSAGQNLTLAEDVRVLLFESVRELLFNAVKHAGVNSARVALRYSTSNELQIIVSDEGRGFDPAQLKPAGETGGGFGLFTIRERLSLIGGSMEMDSSPGMGSRFTLIAPLLKNGL